MDTVIISCHTIEDELRAAMRNTGISYHVTWVESGLHNTPQKLNGRLTEILAGLTADRVLFAMGFCGNALAGIVSERAELIVPRVDDCVSLLLGGMNERRRISSEDAAYFLTEGWLNGEQNLITEYQHSVEVYGKEEADQIAEMMYGHYRTLALLDTGIRSADALWNRTETISAQLHLKRKIIAGTLARLENLLTGPWDADRYLIIPPGTPITLAQMVLE